jgi:hypothetical protein
MFLSLALGPIWWGNQWKSSLQVFDRWDEQVMPAGLLSLFFFFFEKTGIVFHMNKSRFT